MKFFIYFVVILLNFSFCHASMYNIESDIESLKKEISDLKYKISFIPSCKCEGYYITTTYQIDELNNKIDILFDTNLHDYITNTKKFNQLSSDIIELKLKKK